MNALLRQTDDYVPHKLTVDDAIELQAAGAFGDVKVEIIDGVIYHRPMDGELHREWSAALFRWLADNLAREYVVMPNTTLRLGPHDGPSPDWHIFPDTLAAGDVGGPDVLLTIEQSDSSLSRDRGMKAELYAREGVREYWVIDLNARLLHRYREPGPDGYRDTPPPFGADDVVEALLIPGLSLRMADLTRVGGQASAAPKA